VADLVDGNNLIGRLGGGTRDGLVTELCDLARRKRKSLTVVFDGPPDPGRPKVQSFGAVTVVYAAPGRPTRRSSAGSARHATPVASRS